MERSEPKQRFGSPHTRHCIHNVVRTQGGAHIRRFVATAEVLSFKGVRGWPLRRARQAGRRAQRVEAKVWRSTHKAVPTQGGSHTRRCTHKAVCGHRRSLVVLRGVVGLAPASSEASRVSSAASRRVLGGDTGLWGGECRGVPGGGGLRLEGTGGGDFCRLSGVHSGSL